MHKTETIEEEFNFTVDAQLLNELGKKLVGRKFTALAELIKNGYDADAFNVHVRYFDEENGILEIEDDGFGMNLDEFRDYWMKIGSTHKLKWGKTPLLGRQLTGAKGVGRLSVQYLAEELELISIAHEDKLNSMSPKRRLKTSVHWKEAIKTEYLTEAKMKCKSEPTDEETGTKIILRDLRHKWQSSDFKELAKELWMLQPPFQLWKSDAERFEVTLESNKTNVEFEFNKQIQAFLNAHEMQIKGKNENGHVKGLLEPYGGKPVFFEFDLEKRGDGEGLKGGEFTIRIYRLWGKQREGLLVDDVKTYMKKHGGIHVYDTGFRLPHYGTSENDWLGILGEHALRYGLSEYFPDTKKSFLEYIPGIHRILGQVSIETPQEPELEIAITRDRLIESDAYYQLVEMLRRTIHLYAQYTYEKFQNKKNLFSEVIKTADPEFETIEKLLESKKDDMPPETYGELKYGIETIRQTTTETKERTREQLSLLGAFATAGISSVYYQHEMKKQVSTIEHYAHKLGALKIDNHEAKQEIELLRYSMKQWVERARNIHALFDYIGDIKTVKERKRYDARAVLKDVSEQVERLGRGTNIDLNGVEDGVLLPEAAAVEWTAIFQNVFINAFNAMVDSSEKKIAVFHRTPEPGGHELVIMDTGCGVDLKRSDELFKPFVRGIEISQERRQLGYGGNGIGLTIVLMISERIGTTVSFVEPEGDFKTSFSIRWRKKNE